MRIDIISATPDLLESPLNYSIIKRAKEKGIVEIYIHNLREYGLGNYKQIDDTQFGGGGIAQLDGFDKSTCELQKMYFLSDIRGKGLGYKIIEKFKDLLFDCSSKRGIKCLKSFKKRE